MGKYIYGFDAAKLEQPEVLRDFLEHLRILKQHHEEIQIVLTRPTGTPLPWPAGEHNRDVPILKQS